MTVTKPMTVVTKLPPSSIKSRKFPNYSGAVMLVSSLKPPIYICYFPFQVLPRANADL